MNFNTSKYPVDFSEIVEGLPSVIFRMVKTGDDFRAIYATKNVAQFGYAPQEFTSGQVRWLDLVHPDDRVVVKNNMREYETHGIYQYRLNYRLVTKAGDPLFVTEYDTVHKDADGAYTIYDVAIMRNTQADIGQDLAEVHYRQQIAMNEILMSLHDADLDHALQIILDQAGAYLNTSRALLFKDSPDHKTCKVVYEWCNNGITSVKELDYVVTYSTAMPEIYVALQDTGVLLVDYGHIPENCKEEFESEGLIASAIFAVYLNGKHYGFVCFDDCVIPRVWDEETARFLKNISNLISTVLVRQQQAEQLRVTRASLETVLDNIDSYVFVAQPKTETIRFANRAFRQAFGEDCLGQPISSYLPIVLATTQEAPLQGAEEQDYPEIYSEKTGRWLAVSVETITWVDGSQMKLGNCYDVTAKKEYADAIERLAFLDHLTGLANRFRCDVDLAEELQSAQRENGTAYLLFIDMDNFKVVNDSYGHQYGDAILKVFAGFLRQNFPEPNKVFRFGGDEFVVLLSHKQTTPVDAFLQLLLDRARLPWKALDKEFYCTLSIGVVSFPEKEPHDRVQTAATILQHADIAMYEAKHRGKNQYGFYDSRLDAGATRRARLEALLRKSMQNNCEGFHVFYQPVFKAGGGPIQGAQAHLRMNDDDLVLMPEDFIMLADYLGFMSPIGEFLIRKVAQDCKAINDAGHPDFAVSIQLTEKQLRNRELPSQIAAILQETGLKPKNLVLAVSDSLLSGDEQMPNTFMEHLHTLGVRTAVACTEYTGLPFLNVQRLRFDVLSLAAALPKNPEDDFTREYLELLVRMCHAKKRNVCVTNIENAKQEKYYLSFGIDSVQGGCYGNAVAGEALDELLQKT